MACRKAFRMGVTLCDVVGDGRDIHGESVVAAPRLEISPNTAGSACRAKSMLVGPE